jgi:HEAT repeat protein
MKRRRWALVLLGGAATILVAILPFKGPVHDAILRAWYLRKLEKGDWQTQRRAAGELARLHAEEAIPVLIRMADDREKLSWIVPSLVRIGPRGAEAAIDSLDRVAVLEEILGMGPEGFPALESATRALRDPGAQVRSFAAGVLGRIGAPGAVPPLIELLSDENEAVRREASAALGHIGPPARSAIIPIIQRIEEGLVIKDAGEALAAIDPTGTEAVPLLLEASGAAPPSRKIEIARALMNFKDQGPKVISLITGALGDGDLQARRLAAGALKNVIRDEYVRMPEIRSAPVVSALIRALADRSIDVRMIAAEILQIIGRGDPAGEPAKAAPALLALLKGSNRRLAFEAAKALAAMGLHGDEVVPVILEAAASHRQEDWELRIAPWLGFKDPSSTMVPPLMRALSDPDPRVREAAANALIHLKADLVPVIASLSTLLGDGDPRRRLNAVLALEGLGPGAEPALPALITALDDRDQQVAGGAIRALGAIGPSAANNAVPALIGILKSKLPSDRYAVIEALVRIGPGAAGPLLSALDHPLPQVRSGAIEALGKIASPGIDPVPALRKSLKDPESQVRFAAMESLGAHGRGSAAALSALTALIQDPEIEVRLRAAKAIVAAGGPARLVLPTLIAALSEDLSRANMQLWPNEILASLGSEAGPAVPALIERLRKEPLEPPLLGAVVTLAAIGPAASEAIPALEELRKIAFEEYFRTAIDEALGKIRGEPARP